MYVVYFIDHIHHLLNYLKNNSCLYMETEEVLSMSECFAIWDESPWWDVMHFEMVR